jgi:ABC-type sugar transport system ATPase subunit
MLSATFLADLLGMALERGGRGPDRHLLQLGRHRHGVLGRAQGVQRHGDRRREPSLLLLDEPAAGTSASEAAELMAVIRALGAEGLTIVLVEHQIRVVMPVSDRVAVLNHGELIAEGPPDAVRRDRAVIAAYLGKSA